MLRSPRRAVVSPTSPLVNHRWQIFSWRQLSTMIRPSALWLAFVGLVLALAALTIWAGQSPEAEPVQPTALPDAAVAFAATLESVDVPRVCSHRLNPFPSGDVSSLQALSSFVAAGIRCFDLDLFATIDGVVHVGAPDEVNSAIGRDASQPDVLLTATSSQLRQLDVKQRVPTLDELLDLLASLVAVDTDKLAQPSSAGATMSPLSTVTSTTGSDAPLDPSSPSLLPIFVTLEPKPASLRTLAAIQAMLASIASRGTLRETVGIIVHDPSVALDIRAAEAATASRRRPKVTTKASTALTDGRSMLVLPLGDRITARTSLHAHAAAPVSEQICSHDFDLWPLARRLALLAPYDVFAVSARLLHACGTVRTFATGDPALHQAALDSYLRQVSLRAPDRNPLLQSLIQSEMRYAKALEMERNIANEARTSQKMLAERLAQASSAASTRSRPSTFVRPPRQMLSVWNVDSESLLSSIGTSIPRQSWVSRPLSSPPLLRSRALEVPIAFFITNVPAELKQWIADEEEKKQQ